MNYTDNRQIVGPGLELGQAVAAALGLPFVETLARTKPKLEHGRHHALRQAPFDCTLPDPAPTMVVIVDDLVTTGATMRRSLEATRAAGLPRSHSGTVECER